MSNNFQLEDRNRITIVRFVRPKIRNPLSIDVQDELIGLIDTLAAEATRGLIFTGVDDVFASGADLREIASVNGAGAREFAGRGQSLMNRISNADFPTAAAINGFCFGGALDLALSCRFRVASENAEFCHPGVTLGIMTGWGGTQRLPRLVGEQKALEIFLTAKRFGATEALVIGLLDSIADDPVGEAIKLIDQG